MSVTIRVEKTEATISNGIWTSDEAKLAEMLNFWAQGPEPTGYSPDLDYSRALEALKYLGPRAEIIRYDKPEFDPKSIY